MISGSDLYLQQWEDGATVYHAGSGDTHLLNPAAAAGLRVFANGKLEEQAYYHAVAQALDVANDEDLHVLMGDLLRYFCDIQLIERVR